VFKMADQLDLLYRADSPFEKSPIFVSNGKQMDSELAQELMGILEDIIDGHPEEIKAFKGSLGDFVEERHVQCYDSANWFLTY